MNDQKNIILAIVPVGARADRVAIFRRHAADGEAAAGQPSFSQQQTQPAAAAAQPAPGNSPDAPPAPAARSAGATPGRRAAGARPAADRSRARRVTREAVLAASPRIAIETPRSRARSRSRAAASTTSRSSNIARPSIRNRRPIVLLSPSGSPHPFYAEFGWVAAAGTNVKLPGPDTVWTQQGSGTLGVGRPVTLDLRQRRGLRIPPHHHGRRQVSVHGRRQGREQGRGAGRALSLCADFAPRQAGDARLLHPA